MTNIQTNDKWKKKYFFLSQACYQAILFPVFFLILLNCIMTANV